MQSVPVHRGILAVDIEKSTSALGTHPIKEELRQEVYRRLHNLAPLAIKRSMPRPARDSSVRAA